MYYQNYEDYIRSILGYPTVTTSNTQYGNHNYHTYNYEYVSNKPTYNQNVLKLYPEIYKILNPMICKICESNTKPITEELLNQMTEEIYLNIESDSDINITDDRVNNKKENDSKTNNSKNNNMNSSNKTNQETKKLESRNTKVPKNPILRDLIKILILNQLLYGNTRPKNYYYQENQFNQIRPQVQNENRYYRNYLH